ncbi:ComF family protein [Clostridioides difficile]
MGKTILKIIIKIYNEILDIIYPPEEKCIICDESGFIGICPYCKSNIKVSNINDSGNISYGFYGGALKKLILEFKYSGNFIAGDILSEFLLEIINKENINGDIICYVPMTKKSIKKRGFNQCKVIANNISFYTNIDVSNCIKKVKDTREQKTLSKEERNINVKGVFAITNDSDIKGKNVILIDDVMTTGATVNECKNILKKSGANKIFILTIAKSNI